jgi:ketosteroid isomerase-like protein
MRTLTLIILASLLLFSIPANASPESDVTDTVQKWFDAFNKADAKTVTSSCTKNATILDNFPPHLWQGPDACSKWYSDFKIFAAKNKITEAYVALGKAQHVDITGDIAYVVIPTTYQFKLDGKLENHTSIVTLKMHKSATAWQLAAWAWADQQ